MFKDIVLSNLSNVTGENKKDFFATCLKSKECLISNVLIPISLMGEKNYDSARKVFVGKGSSYTPLKAPHFKKFPESLRTTLTKIDTSDEIQDILKIVNNYIKNIDVTPFPEAHAYKKGGFHSYYKNKKEDFSITSQEKWTNKQKNIYLLFTQLHPKKVLDIGANMGWFSKLAEHLGSEVIATDIDTYCIDSLYKETQYHKLNILPVILSFEDFFEKNTSNRYKSEVVLCLALVHHLFFISDLSLENIFKTLSDLTEKVLILEYVDSNDPRIRKAVTQPDTFFNNETLKKRFLIAYNKKKKYYNLSAFLNIGKKYFDSVTIMDSFPKGRKLLVFKKHTGKIGAAE